MEQSQDQAPPAEASTEATTAEPAAQHTDAAGAPTATATTEPNDLVSEAEFTAIQTQFPGDPAKQRAELNKAWTQKTQKLAPYADLIKAYERDPKGTIETLAKQQGLTLGQPAAESKATEQSTTAAATIADQAMEAVKAELGPELDFLAGPIGKAMHKVAEMVAKTVTEQTVKPLKEHQAQVTETAAKDQVALVIKQFEAKHPDWKAHEPAMAQLATKIQPNGMAELDYMDLLYTQVTLPQQIESATKKAIEKMTKAAETAETRTEGTPESKVSITRNTPNSIAEAFAMAKRGERVED